MYSYGCVASGVGAAGAPSLAFPDLFARTLLATFLQAFPDSRPQFTAPNFQQFLVDVSYELFAGMHSYSYSARVSV